MIYTWTTEHDTEKGVVTHKFEGGHVTFEMNPTNGNAYLKRDGVVVDSAQLWEYTPLAYERWILARAIEADALNKFNTSETEA